ncbi:23808_t:CDS:2, partial [Dentiscutata erythropus]
NSKPFATVANNKIQTTSKPNQSTKRNHKRKKVDHSSVDNLQKKNTVASFSQIIDDLLNNANNPK